MRIIRRFALPFIIAMLSFCQDAPLTIDQILKMSKAGLPDDVILAKIGAESKPLAVTTEDLIALKSAGVTDPVIRLLVSGPAKVEKAPPSVSAGPAVAPPSSDPNDPMAAHDPGIYLFTESREGGKRLIQIERAGAGHEKTAGLFSHAMTYGIAKAKVKAELPGARATVRSAETKPVFYMYFPPTGNLGSADTITSPSQFTLLSLEVKKDHRETAVAKTGFINTSAGTDEKRTFKILSEKVRAYAYRITPETGLKEGEYAFVASSGMGGTAAAGSVVVFDFGLDLK